MKSSKESRREVHGFLLLDKPTGLTSNAALQKIKKLFNARKAGHTGSLDPLASGMLPICFGQASKFAQYLLAADKAYECTAQLGVTTTTGDSDGEIVAQTPVPEISEQQIENVLEKFIGTITQTPSMYSALKYQGKPLYYYARKGIDVPRKTREVTLRQLQVTLESHDRLQLNVECSKGTYIRSLVEDIGQMLGCGAHVTMLRRTWAAPFQNDKMVTLPTLLEEAAAGSDLDQYLLPIDHALQHLPAMTLSAEAVTKLYYGQVVEGSEIPQIAHENQTKVGNAEDGDGNLFRLYDSNEHFIGLGTLTVEKKLVSARLLALSVV